MFSIFILSNCIILYYIKLYQRIFRFSMLYCIKLYVVFFDCTKRNFLYHTILYCTVLYYTAPHYITLYCMISNYILVYSILSNYVLSSFVLFHWTVFHYVIFDNNTIFNCITQFFNCILSYIQVVLFHIILYILYYTVFYCAIFLLYRIVQYSYVSLCYHVLCMYAVCSDTCMFICTLYILSQHFHSDPRSPKTRRFLAFQHGWPSTLAVMKHLEASDWAQGPSRYALSNID